MKPAATHTTCALNASTSRHARCIWKQLKPARPSKASPTDPSQKPPASSEWPPYPVYPHQCRRNHAAQSLLPHRPHPHRAAHSRQPAPASNRQGRLVRTHLKSRSPAEIQHLRILADAPDERRRLPPAHHQRQSLLPQKGSGPSVQAQARPSVQAQASI